MALVRARGCGGSTATCRGATSTTPTPCWCPRSCCSRPRWRAWDGSGSASWRCSPRSTRWRRPHTADVLAAVAGARLQPPRPRAQAAADHCAAERRRAPARHGRGAAGSLPGIGPATAAGVMAFAFNRPLALPGDERAHRVHPQLFPGPRGRERTGSSSRWWRTRCPEEGRPRAWYYALLDYGAHLKPQVANPSRRSAHHTRQSAFEGSRRQKRAELVRIVLAAPGIAAPELAGRLDAFEAAPPAAPAWMRTCSTASCVDLVSEGFFRREGDLIFRVGAPGRYWPQPPFSSIR